jgi:hypothetical protein
MMEGIKSSMIYLIYCRNFCKCHNVPPTTTIKNKNKKNKNRKKRICMDFPSFSVIILYESLPKIIDVGIVFFYWDIVFVCLYWVPCGNSIPVYTVETSNQGNKHLCLSTINHFYIWGVSILLVILKYIVYCFNQ